MARKTVLVSDLSGREIPEGQHALVAITVTGSRYTADVIKDEVENLLAVAAKGKKRGRPSTKNQ